MNFRFQVVARGASGLATLVLPDDPAMQNDIDRVVGQACFYLQ